MQKQNMTFVDITWSITENKTSTGRGLPKF